MTRKITRPSEAEDRAITESAATDPDTPLLSDAEMAEFRPVRGPQRTPTKAQVTVRLDPDVLEWLKASGRGWQTRMNDMLRREMED